MIANLPRALAGRLWVYAAAADIPKMKAAILLACVLAAPIAQTDGAPRRVVPPDRSTIDPSFLQFLERLKVIVATEDVEALAGILPEGLSVSFEGYASAQFLKELREHRPEQADFWPELREALRLGPRCVPAFCAVPYTYPSDETDVGELNVTAAGVRVRTAPTASSAVLAVIAYEVVKQVDVDEGLRRPAAQTVRPARCGSSRTASWIRVRLQDGRTGWLCSRFAREPLDYRFIFEKTRAGSWQLTKWAAGD